MSNPLKEFELDETSSKISYMDGDPLKLNNEFNFFHNKNKFRRELNDLQYIFKDYTGNSLVASGIRDSYLKKEISDNFLVMVFSTNETIKNASHIVEPRINLAFEEGSYYIESRDKYILLLSKDMKGLKSGINVLEMIFTQVFENYLKINNLEEYVKIRPFNLFSK